MASLTRPVGERFKFQHVFLEVRAAPDCNGCYFHHDDGEGNICKFNEGRYNMNEFEYVGYCLMEERPDRKNVIFRKVLKPLKRYNRNEYTKKILQTRGRTIHVPRRGA